MLNLQLFYVNLCTCQCLTHLDHQFHLANQQSDNNQQRYIFIFYVQTLSLCTHTYRYIYLAHVHIKIYYFRVINER